MKLQYFIFKMTLTDGENFKTEVGLIAAESMGEAVCKIKDSCGYVFRISVEEIRDAKEYDLPYIFLPNDEAILQKIQDVNDSEFAEGCQED